MPNDVSVAIGCTSIANLAGRGLLALTTIQSAVLADSF